MATVERAIRNLRAARDGLRRDIRDARRDINLTHDGAEVRRLKYEIKENQMRVGAIDYALNFLEVEEEVVCLG